MMSFKPVWNITKILMCIPFSMISNAHARESFVKCWQAVRMIRWLYLPDQAANTPANGRKPSFGTRRDKKKRGRGRGVKGGSDGVKKKELTRSESCSRLRKAAGDKDSSTCACSVGCSWDVLCLFSSAASACTTLLDFANGVKARVGSRSALLCSALLQI